MGSRVWCEHCDGEFSERGTVTVSGREPAPTDGDGRRYRRRGRDFVVPTGKRADHILGNICCHCMAAWEAMERGD